MKTKFDDNSLLDEICSNCGSYKIDFDPEHGFYRCQSCGTVWASDDDDPDYDDLIHESINTPDEATTQ